jgi:hypothetical protein
MRSAARLRGSLCARPSGIAAERVQLGRRTAGAQVHDRSLLSRHVAATSSWPSGVLERVMYFHFDPCAPLGDKLDNVNRPDSVQPFVKATYA